MHAFPRLAVVLLSASLVACGDDATSQPDDASTPVDATITELDASGCPSFEGAYGVGLDETCLRGTALELGTLCIAQHGCAATISGSLGAIDATVEGDVLRFEAGGLACTGRRDRGAIDITCSDESIGFSCEARASSTRALDHACCVADDECTAEERCAPVNLGLDAPAPIVSACVRRGAAMAGEACTVGGSGTDDCGAGLTCTAGSLGDDMIVCRSICRDDGECGEGQACRWYALTAPPVGYCVPSCTRFGTECPSFATCDGATVLDAEGAITDGLACRAIGTTPSGEICHRSVDCPADHACTRAGAPEARCRPFCDDAHPCDESSTCMPQGSGDASGLCVPR
ncbi:hypothetical protein [Sandaracinus amylolyticus]|uniref:hypothetical protein n=1 Tax=Sandaracinus amylolyticus TaxID=927083 RepID=UPI001F29D847|nr:hypothetical protein [Sandaracinus amylolyticus]